MKEFQNIKFRIEDRVARITFARPPLNIFNLAMMREIGDALSQSAQHRDLAAIVFDGAALGGGCELVAACDIVVASDRARFGQPEIKLGVFPPVAAVLLPRIIGDKKAREMILLGEIIDAGEALRLGLVNHVTPSSE